MRTTILMVALGLVGCSGEIGREEGLGGPSPAGTGAPGTAGTSAGSTGGGSSGGSGSNPMSTVESPSPRFVRQLTLSEYQNTVQDLLFVTNPDTTAIPPDVSMKGYTTNVAGSFVDETHLDAYMAVAQTLSNRAVTESYAKVVPCATQDMACASTFLDKFGSRAFRRPLNPDEKTRYLKYFDPSLSGADFKTGVTLSIWSMLVSPNFLYRSELGDDGGSGAFKLSPYETATALSYAYWGTMPDDALFQSAASGALANRTGIEAQARRLLADPRGRARIATFFSEWIEASRAYVATKDTATFPALYQDPGGPNAIVDAMRAEEDGFVTNVAFDSTKKFSELFNPGYTFVNDRLAAYYGLPLPGTGERTTKVALQPGSARGGLITLGMFLYGHARTDQSSPVQRGHMVRANILCTDVPPPPMGVDATVHPGTPGKTGREQIEALTSTGICPTCHGLMNPIGFALEGFGGAADERTMDNGEAVDTSGEMKGFNDASGMTIAFNGARQLSDILSGMPQAQSCFASNYHRYTRGYLAVGVDAGAVNKLAQDFVTKNLDMPELFLGVALQDSFTTRRSVEDFTQ